MSNDEPKLSDIVSHIEPQLRQKWDKVKEELADFVYISLAEDILRAEVESVLNDLRTDFIRYRQGELYDFSIAPLLAPEKGIRVQIELLGQTSNWDFSLFLTNFKKKISLGLRFNEVGLPIPEAFEKAWPLKETLEKENSIREIVGRCIPLLLAKSIPDYPSPGSPEESSEQAL